MGQNPGSQYAMGHQFAGSSCWYDVPPSGQSHALNRWCFVGGPNNTGGSADYEQDEWNGSSWVNVWKITSTGSISGTAAADIGLLDAANTFTGTLTLDNNLVVNNTSGGAIFNTYSGGMAISTLLQLGPNCNNINASNTTCSFLTWENLGAWNGSASFVLSAENLWLTNGGGSTVPTTATYQIKPQTTYGTSSITQTKYDLSSWNIVQLPASLTVDGTAGLSATLSAGDCTITTVGGVVTTMSGTDCGSGTTTHDAYWSSAGCSFPADTNGQSCTLPMTIPNGGFADAGYTVECTAYVNNSTYNSFGYVMVKNGTKTSTGFDLLLVEDWGNNAGAGNSWPEIDCHAHHN